jgi:hypothetical protein
MVTFYIKFDFTYRAILLSNLSLAQVAYIAMQTPSGVSQEEGNKNRSQGVFKIRCTAFNHPSLETVHVCVIKVFL